MSSYFCQCIFGLLEVAWRSQSENACVIPLDFAQFPSLRLVPICIPTRHLQVPFPAAYSIQYIIKTLGFIHLKGEGCYLMFFILQLSYYNKSDWTHFNIFKVPYLFLPVNFLFIPLVQFFYTVFSPFCCSILSFLCSRGTLCCNLRIFFQFFLYVFI